MPLELFGVEINIAQRAGRVAARFIVKMGRGGVAALPAGGDRMCPHLWPELHHRDKAVARSAVPAPGARLGSRTERGERAVIARREGYRDAGRGIAERMVDGARDALEAVDLAPRHAPAAKVA